MNTESEAIDPVQHLGLVHHIVARFFRNKSKGLPIKDTEEYSDGVVGLLIASERYDSSKHDVEFSTYAFKCIKTEILSGLRRRKRGFQEVCSLDETEIVEEYSVHPELTLIDKLCEPHELDSDTDVRNKRILYDHFMNDITWKEIGDQHGFTKAFAQQCGKNAIALIKKQFGITEDSSFEELLLT